ncbi:MAG TPA: beta-ketoacyl-ACP synthase III [Cytophagales bacterium]|nr:beta-ketoacyl-ACP synthase III [Cytophagales bacterium]
MTPVRTFNIAGIGKYLPQKQVSSHALEEQLQLPEGWIEQYIGVQTRYLAETESNTEMGAKALQSALNDAGITIGDLDCLIGAAGTFDHVIPNRSSLIKAAFKEAHLYDFPCVDINTVCTSFITALDYASLLIQSGQHQTIAIVTSEISSKGLDPSNTETYCLFGDGAAAVILTAGDDGGLIHSNQKTYSEGAINTMIAGGGNQYHPKDYPYDPALYSFKMDGKKLLKLAHQHLEEFIINFFSKSSLRLNEVNWIVPHQASKLGLRMLCSLEEIESEKVIDQLSLYGNGIAASIPIALITSIEQGKIKEQDTCFLIGTAAGMSISGLLLKYTKS